MIRRGLMTNGSARRGGNRTRLSRVAAHTDFEDSNSSANVGIDSKATGQGSDPVQHRREPGPTQQWQQWQFCASVRASGNASPSPDLQLSGSDPRRQQPSTAPAPGYHSTQGLP